MTKSNGKSSNLIWNLFSSIRLTLVLLIILAIASIMGTLIPQEEQGAAQFAQGLSPGTREFLMSLNLFDMYHSLWFRIIIGALALNLVVCSIDRLPRTLRLFRSRPKPDRSKPFENLAPDRSFSIGGEFHKVGAKVAELLKRPYKGLEIKNTDETIFCYGERGRYSYFGVYVVHLSVLLILIGGIMGSLLGFDAYVNIPEGGTINSVALRKNNTPKSLGFEVRCEKFTLEFYEQGAPKEFRSDLVFFADGKVAQRGSLLVNHPMTFRGITFYQSSYGTMAGDRVRLKISREMSDPQISTLVAELGESLQLPGGEGEFKVADIRPDFMRMGPAVLISVKGTEGNDIRFWVFKHYEEIKKRMPGIFKQFPKLNPAVHKPYTFFLDNVESKYYTGLQVNRDPGVLLVWLGCFAMVAGFFITFFISHKQVWVRVSKTKKGVKVSLAGRANRNPVGLERELDLLTHKLRSRLE